MHILFLDSSGSVARGCPIITLPLPSHRGRCPGLTEEGRTPFWRVSRDGAAMDGAGAGAAAAGFRMGVRPRDLGGDFAAAARRAAPARRPRAPRELRPLGNPVLPMAPLTGHDWRMARRAQPFGSLTDRRGSGRSSGSSFVPVRGLTRGRGRGRAPRVAFYPAYGIATAGLPPNVVRRRRGLPVAYTGHHVFGDMPPGYLVTRM